MNIFYFVHSVPLLAMGNSSSQLHMALVARAVCASQPQSWVTIQTEPAAVTIEGELRFRQDEVCKEGIHLLQGSALRSHMATFTMTQLPAACLQEETSLVERDKAFRTSFGLRKHHGVFPGMRATSTFC